MRCLSLTLWGLSLALMSASLACSPTPMSQPASKADDAIAFEGLSATQWRNDQVRLRVDAKTARLSDRTKLKGHAVLAVFTSSTGPAARVSSAQAQADLESGNVRFEGDARIKRAGFEVHAQEFSYEAAAQQLRSSPGVAVSGSGLKLQSPGRAQWDVAKQSARLEGPVQARATP